MPYATQLTHDVLAQVRQSNIGTKLILQNKPEVMVKTKICQHGVGFLVSY